MCGSPTPTWIPTIEERERKARLEALREGQERRAKEAALVREKCECAENEWEHAEKERFLAKLRAALILDMIGFTADDDLDILFETDTHHGILTRRPVVLAADYTVLRCETSTNPFGSDPVPFLNAGLPAMLAIENDWDAYPAYHRSTDLPGLISPEIAREALRVITAWTLDMANLTDTPATVSGVKVANGALTIVGGRFRKDDQVVVEGTLFDAPKASKASGDGTFSRLRVKDARIASIFQSGKTLRIEVVHPETGVRSKAFSFKS